MDKEEPVWKDFKEHLDKLEDGTEVSLNLFNAKGAILSLATKYPRDPGPMIWVAALGEESAAEIFRFVVKKTKKGKFPFTLSSFEVNAGFIKANFKRKRRS